MLKNKNIMFIIIRLKAKNIILFVGMYASE